MNFYYDSKSTDCKKPFGAVMQGQTVEFYTYAKDGVFINSVCLVMVEDLSGDIKKYPLSYLFKFNGESKFGCTINAPQSGLYWYYFEVDTEVGVFNHINQRTNGYFQLTVYDRDYRTPDRFKGGVIYHIFVDRFFKGDDHEVDKSTHSVYKDWNQPLTLKDPDGVYRANDFYGGNFEGIISKLPYLKELGVTIIYLSPIFKSASNHRYDTGNYLTIDPLLGTEQKFKQLLDDAKKHGISVMLDGVFNHTGADSLYFNKFNTYDSVGAYQSKQSPYYDWYDFEEYPDKYRCWWGVTVCPTVNKKAQGYRELILGQGGVIDKWSRLGVDAWRLDVVDELPEDFVIELRKSVKEVSKNNLLIGEVWEDASNKISYSQRRHYLLGSELDGVMNYPFKDAIINYARGGNADDFVNVISTICENYPVQSLDCSMTLIGSHDTVRVLNRLSDYNIDGLDKQGRANVVIQGELLEIAKKRVKIASALQYILPGIPSVYYGDEIGMQGYDDPLCRMPMTWDNMDGELLEHYKMLGKIRKKYKSFMTGGLNVYQKNGLLCVERMLNGKKLLLVVNTLGERRQIELDCDYCEVGSSDVCPKLQTLEKNSFKLLFSL